MCIEKAASLSFELLPYMLEFVDGQSWNTRQTDTHTQAILQKGKKGSH